MVLGAGLAVLLMVVLYDTPSQSALFFAGLAGLIIGEAIRLSIMR